MKTKKNTNTSAKISRFRPGTTGECEAQLWYFTCPHGIPADEDAQHEHWVAAESLESALRYMRHRHDDFTIAEARFLGMIPILSGSPLD
jgi:hypothetical protein